MCLGVLTFLFFPITVFHAYVTDRRLIKFDFVPKRFRMGKRGILEATETADVELNNVDGMAYLKSTIPFRWLIKTSF